MKSYSFIFLLFFSASLFALNEKSIIHGTAVTSDGQWNAVSVLNDDVHDLDNRESIWVYRSNAHWDFPFCLISFRSQKGWSIPSVCYDKKADSFIVYHNCWTWENKDGGLFEFPRVNGKFEPVNFQHSETSSDLGTAMLLSNDCGVFLAGLYGKWSGEENRNTKIFRLKRKDGHLELSEIDSMKNLEFAHIDWRNRKFTMDDQTFREVIFSTSNGIVALDKNERDWWYFDCNSEKLKKFNSKEDALSYSKNSAQNQNVKIWQIIALASSVILILILALAVIYLLKKNRQKKSSATKEKNQFIFSIQEKERAKISRDIHDSVIQDIRVIRLETENLKVFNESRNLQNKLEDIATDCIVKLRNICYNLAPAELMIHSEENSSKLELLSIINSLAQQFSSRTHIPCSVGVENDFEYPVFEKEVTQNLFRIIQESLTNIEKHSYATQTSIFIKRENEKTVIYITDDGIGCSEDIIKSSLKSREHLGFRSMKDRMELIGGKIDFISNQDDGMEVRLEI